MLFAEWLKSKRSENNWTLTELSERSGIPISTLSSWERGKNIPLYSESIGKLANVFDARLCEVPLDEDFERKKD